MARDPAFAASSVFSALRTFRRPWPLLGAGLAFVLIGLALTQTPLVPLRVLCLGAGILLASIAVARRLQTATWEHLEDRAESAGLLAMTAFVALLAWFNMEPDWDSGSIFLGAVIILALLGAGIVLLPRTGRRIAAVLFVLWHFGGILTSVTAVPPRNEPAPWLSLHLWTHVYRHYLTFAYLTNAYHFYSPDPGPPTLLWFHVEYADGSARWIKIPSRRESPIGLHHQRMLAAAESAYNPIIGFPMDDPKQIRLWEQKFQRKYELLPGIPHDTATQFGDRRRKGADLNVFVDPKNPRRALPLLVTDEPLMNQFSEPQEMARRLLASYARHVARTSPHQQDPRIPVQAVRVYRVIHMLLAPQQLYHTRDADHLLAKITDPTTFMPYYMGKYDTDGRLLDPQDPFLFWHVPIVRLPTRYPEPGTFRVDPVSGAHLLKTDYTEFDPEPTEIVDFVELHATQSDRFLKTEDK